jgi:polyhydroxybutyrate depolymerase
MIIAVVIVLAVSYGHRTPTVKTERTTIPAGYSSAGRELAVHADAKPGKPVPLVLVLHDDIGDNNATMIEKASKASAVADQQKFALAYPEAVASKWQINDTDAQYLRDVVRYIAEKRSTIDMSRIYIWGMGEGGHMARTAACKLFQSDSPQKPLFAAVGVVGADPDKPPVATCPTQVPEAKPDTKNKTKLDTKEWNRATTDALWESSKEVHG